MAEEEREYRTCLVTVKDNYAIITFNRPDKLNALSLSGLLKVIIA